MTTLRLVLGDQLNSRHSWFAHVDPEVVYVLMEMRQETDYVLHHAQKILAIFAAMRRFAWALRAAGHRVHYLAIDAPDNHQRIDANLDALIPRFAVRRFEYQAPDEWRLDQMLEHYAAKLPIAAQMVESEHFLSARREALSLFGSRERWLMERFYRHMRLRHAVLLESGSEPAGGRWNFDADNRRPWRGTPPLPADTRTHHDHAALWKTISAAGVNSFGAPQAHSLPWPQGRAEALRQFEAFVAYALPHFGPYQDAMHSQAPRLFHGLLSFALNTKMLAPREVIVRVEKAWRAGAVPLASAEGFIRQVLGWREYVRNVYWSRMPGYAQVNALDHRRPLPSWFWNGRTHMRCLALAIGQSLREAYAHHIQRLMVIGNFALLAELDPHAVHRWYLGVYIDAFEWVELPNTLGMSQFADGGLITTKPYIAGAAYIDRMGDYCKGCRYDRRARTGARACPFNALYWQFLDRHRERLGTLPRLAMAYRQWDRFSTEARAAVREHARLTLEQLDTL
ncbi:cryptochrome/photolyase family protein [Cupriavidus basilensis]|uniref:Cryptochrome/photolyase family protein n=1 Tax=Cupriavidus basilensis TaxID=68895 RepID=A0A643FK93_9BURK|nr:cryptochrome/photolyase family protein [Cupriavidus basilensis]QOT79476.1 cryptochrome/photolyase family protein [Cupriavidus basilensis]